MIHAVSRAVAAQVNNVGSRERERELFVLEEKKKTRESGERKKKKRKTKFFSTTAGCLHIRRFTFLFPPFNWLLSLPRNLALASSSLPSFSRA